MAQKITEKRKFEAQSVHVKNHAKSDISVRVATLIYKTKRQC